MMLRTRNGTMMARENLSQMASHREAEIVRLRTALREAKENMENDDEASAYLIIKNALNPPRIEQAPTGKASREKTKIFARRS
jgi:hypothetical protein